MDDVLSVEGVEANSYITKVVIGQTAVVQVAGGKAKNERG